MRIRCEHVFITLVIGYWCKVPMDYLMMPGKAARSFALQKAFRTGEGRVRTTRWISHTLKKKTVDTRPATDLSVFAGHTTTQANSCVPTQKQNPNPNKSPTLILVFCTCSYSTIHSPQSLLHHNLSLSTIHRKTLSFETKFHP